jgi:GT2 family glycosyltransferase
MSEQKPDKLDRNDPAAAVIFAYADRSTPAGPEWYQQLQALGYPVYTHRETPGCGQTRHGYHELGKLLIELCGLAPGSVILLMHSDLDPDPDVLDSLVRQAAAGDGCAVFTALSNADAGCNPFAGLEGNYSGDSAGLGRTIDLLGPGNVHPHYQWPHHVAALSAGAIATLAEPGISPASALTALQEAGGEVILPDRLFLHAPALKLCNSVTLDPHETPRATAWGSLSARLQDWLEAGCPQLAGDVASSGGATLHITHSWGGGVALWIRTFIRHDPETTHFQLRSEGPQAGQGHGQLLVLYAGDQLDCPVGEWWLQPPIQSVAGVHPDYRAVLEEICRRYAIGRIMVSSLVGHSLEALETGVPTVQVLHDHFPLWPFLSAHPLDYTDEDGLPDFEAALADRKLRKEFPDLGHRGWQRIKDRYFEIIETSDVAIAAPGPWVVEMQARLDARWKSIPVSVIPHGFPPLAADRPLQARPRRDQRLRLVILGRIQGGKGQALLLDALQDLQEYAQVYLVGTGKSGEAFFGIPGVNVIVDYQREALPDLLARIGPDVAALLSVVPETFSYTLSELQFLGIPTIATRIGSFPGRIEHGKNGWLIEARPAALADLVAQLFADPEALARVRGALAKLIPGGPKDMVAAYRELCSPTERAGSGPLTVPGLAGKQAAAMADRATRHRAARQAAERESEALRKEVSQRTEWALDTRRALEEEQENTRRWVGLLQAEIDELRTRVRSQQDELERADLSLAAARQELEIGRQELEITRQVLEERSTLLRQVSADLEHVQEVHEQILASSSWRITRPFRVLRRAGANFMRSRAWNPLRWPLLLSGLVRNLSTLGWRGTLMRLQFGGYEAPPAPLTVEVADPADQPDPPDSVPYSAQPLVSIIIPAYNQWTYTAACLRSIAGARCLQAIEVILVDDGSNDETESAALGVDALVYLRNETNLGFIGSCNRGAEAARGEYLVMLNNDTQVTDGWLDNLLDTFREYPDTGLAGSRLVYPDGSLQECGGMVFSDGSGWNYGRGDNPDRPAYQYVRETAYCSGACIMIRTDLFRELGGFDEHYSPAYYEDTDLAFRVRRHGLKVRVQPASTVIHHEGVTSGTDTSSGAKRHQVSNQEKFLQRWQKELEAFPPRIEDPTNPANIRAARDHHLLGRVLIIDATTPEPDQDSGSLRLTHVMRCFRDLGYGVTFFAENHVHAGRYTRDLQQWGIEVQYQPWLDSNQAFFRQRGAEFDLVFISRHYIASNFADLVKRFCPNASFVFDTVDLHYLREQRLAELEDSLPLRRVAEQTRRSELAVIEQSDAVLVVSETEVGVLAEDAPDALVHVLSNIHDVPGRRVEFNDRSDLFFVGGYQHPPNVDAAHWFVTRIWPLIHAQLPGVNFHLIGSKAPDSIRELKSDGVIFHGFVEDLDHYLDHCRMAVAPLRYGAGVKGKVNQSMAHGQPVVATPVAIEGIHAEHGRDVLVAETEQEFADEVVRLYRDESLWQRISDASIVNVETHFSVAAAQRSIRELIEKLR